MATHAYQSFKATCVYNLPELVASIYVDVSLQGTLLPLERTVVLPQMPLKHALTLALWETLVQQLAIHKICAHNQQERAEYTRALACKLDIPLAGDLNRVKVCVISSGLKNIKLWNQELNLVDQMRLCSWKQFGILSKPVQQG